MNFVPFRFERIATPQEMTERKRASIEFLSRPELQPQERARLDSKLLAYLKAIQDMPGIPATDRDEKLGLHPRDASRMRKQMHHFGLVEQIEVQTGRGRPFMDLRLTLEGKQVVENQEENR